MDVEKILNSQFVMTDDGRIDKVRDLYTIYNPEVDLEALKTGGYIEAVGRMMEPVLGQFDDRAPEVLAYWAKRGMVKEFHGDLSSMSWTEYEAKTGYHWDVPENCRQNRFKRWNSFVPVSAFDPANRGRTYPVVIVLHGGFHPISIVDGWGFVQEAARREWIVIVPSLELDDILDEILAEAKTLYPVDESRIYVTGFSYGGFMSNFLGNKRPDVYAACAPCGAPLSNGFVEQAIGPEPQAPFDGVPRALAMQTYMPVFNAIGELDGHRFPVCHADESGGRMRNSMQELLDGINSWARVNHAPEITEASVLALRDGAEATAEERVLGIPLAPGCGHTIVSDGVTNVLGDLKSDDGVVRVRLMCMRNMPHWPTPEMVHQIFEFFSHFSRDPATKESIYTA